MPKPIITALALILTGAFVRITATPCEKLDLSTLPVYIGEIQDPKVRVIYEDDIDDYLLIIVDGVVHIYYP